MPLRELFLSHHHEDAPEVCELATELRLRGVVPWVDKQRGGFSIGDESIPEARRVIREDCFGLVLYATRDAFEKSWFIKHVEIDEARQMLRVDPDFVLFAIAREMGFGQLKEISMREFGVDLSAYHGESFGEKPASAAILRAKWIATARGVLEKIVARNAAGQTTMSLQMSTRDLFPDDPADVLRIDGTHLFRERIDAPRAWARVLAGLRDVKDELARSYGRPRLSVHGSKHLTAAFMIGRVFSPFELDIRQTREHVWRTDSSPAPSAPLAVTMLPGAHSSSQLFVEMASRNKDVSVGVGAFIARHCPESPTRLQLAPSEGPLDVDNEICRAMVRQTYAEIEMAMRGKTYTSIHLFAAAPQAFMMMLGREFKGMPPVDLHEWTERGYVRSCTIPGNVL